MAQTLVQGTSSDRGLRGALTWASPGTGLWVASRNDPDGVHFLGFVERSLDGYVAVDGAGASVGRHGELDAAKRAVRIANDPAHWSDTGAPVLSARTLRAR